MKKLGLTTIILAVYSQFLCAEALDVCDTNSPNLVKIVKEDELKNLAKNTSEKLKEVFVEPSKVTCSSITYQIPETKIAPGESLYFYVPEEFRSRSVRSLTIGHRQDPLTNPNEGWDDKPGLSSVQVLSKNNWYYWSGSASGDKGDKFAEANFSPEMENLYDWNILGYRNVKTGEHKVEGLLPEAVKVISSGKDDVLFSHLTLKISPVAEKSREEKIFSPGTSFTSADGKTPYKLGGGQGFQGTFPDAKVLNHGETMELPLSPGKKLSSIEIAIGDSKPNKQINSDGGWGSKGGARVSIGIQTEKGIDWVISRENVPPEGIIQGTPTDCDTEIKNGDKVIIKVDYDTAYIMGVKIGY